MSNDDVMKGNEKFIDLSTETSSHRWGDAQEQECKKISNFKKEIKFFCDKFESKSSQRGYFHSIDINSNWFERTREAGSKKKYIFLSIQAQTDVYNKNKNVCTSKDKHP